MSEVVATIILLALTVVLFSAIFAFVTSFPSPPAQSSNQFQASLVSGQNTSSKCTSKACQAILVVTTINILHLAGPVVPSSALVYLKSAANPLGPEFASPYTMAQGGFPSSTWNLGQTWSYTFPAGLQPTLPDNITIYIVNSGTLLFSVILPGQSFSYPPTFIATSVSPGTPTVGATFTISATLAGTVNTNSVYVNLAGVPGFSTGSSEMTLGSNGQYSISSSVLGKSTANGTYYAILNASNSAGQSVTTSLAITIFPSGSSGGGSSGVSVGVYLTPTGQSPGAAQGQTPQGSYQTAAALVTYTGTVSGAALTVTFTGTPTAGNTTGAAWTASGPTGLTISGPSTVTVYSTTAWALPTNATVTGYTVTATATVATVGSATGTYSFTPILGAIWSYSTTSGAAGTTFKTSPATTCSTTKTPYCPYISAEFWNNGTASLTINGSIAIVGTTTTTTTFTGVTLGAGLNLIESSSARFQPTAGTHYRITVVAVMALSTGGAVGVVSFSWEAYN